MESIRQTEGEIDVIVRSNLEMDKDYRRSFLYFLRHYISTISYFNLLLIFIPTNRISFLQISLSRKSVNRLLKTPLYREGYRA